MKFSVNSTVSILSDPNSTLELLNGTNETVTVEVSNTSVLSQITNLDKSFQTNATRTGLPKMSTTEIISLNETITKPVVLSQNLTSSKLKEPSSPGESSTKVFQKTTEKMKEKTFQTMKETQKQTSESPTSIKLTSYRKSLSSENVKEKDNYSTISFSPSLTKQQNSNIIFSTKSFIIEETAEIKKISQTSPQTTTITTPRTTTITTTTMTTKPTTTTATTTTTTKTPTETLPPSLPSTKNTITSTENIIKEKKTKENFENTTPKSIEISNPITITNKPQIKKTTQKIFNSTPANKIDKSTKIATKLYKKYPEKSTSNGINSSKYKRVKTEKLVETTLRGKQKNSTPVSTNSRDWKTISKSHLQRPIQNYKKQNVSSENPANAYGGIKISTASHFLNSQYSIDNENMESTTTPNITMGAGPLVIVVLLPFLALFLIAIVTALRRKMKKSRRSIVRVQSRDLDNTSERNQSQMIPLTKSEPND